MSTGNILKYSIICIWGKISVFYRQTINLFKKIKTKSKWNCMTRMDNITFATFIHTVIFNFSQTELDCEIVKTNDWSKEYNQTLETILNGQYIGIHQRYFHIWKLVLRHFIHNGIGDYRLTSQFAITRFRLSS